MTPATQREAFSPRWPPSVGGTACRPLPHRAPRADETEQLGKCSENCKALRQSDGRLPFSAVRNPPGGPPLPRETPSASALVASAPRLPPCQTHPSRPPRLSTRSHSGPEPAPRPPHPCHEARALRGSPGDGRATASTPCPALAVSPCPPTPRFPRQPRHRSAASGARARGRREARAQARARPSRRREAARAPPSAVGGGAEGAAGPRGGGGAERGAPGARAEAGAAAEPSESRARAAGMCPRSRPRPELPLPHCPSPVVGAGVGGTGQGLQDACLEGAGILPLTFIPLAGGARRGCVGQPRASAPAWGPASCHMLLIYFCKLPWFGSSCRCLTSHSLPPCAILHLLIKHASWRGGLLLGGIPLQYGRRAPIFGFQTWYRGGNPTP